MTNYLLTKGYKYYVRLSGSGQPVLGSMVARRVPPRRSNGTWADITSCLAGCCTPNFTMNYSEITIDAETATEGNIIDFLGIRASEPSMTFTFTTINITDGFILNEDGSYEVFPDFVGVVQVIITDNYGNSKTIEITINTTA